MFGNSLLKDKDSGNRAPKPPPRRTGGWADESSKAGNLERQLSTMRLQRQEPSKDISNIPDVDVQEDEELDSGLRKTENLSKVATYKELDDDFSKTGNFAFLQDVDLRPLAKHLLPESQIKDADIIWNWEVIFAELSPELELNKTSSK